MSFWGFCVAGLLEMISYELLSLISKDLMEIQDLFLVVVNHAAYFLHLALLSSVGGTLRIDLLNGRLLQVIGCVESVEIPRVD
jgi:hypothetical protein